MIAQSSIQAQNTIEFGYHCINCLCTEVGFSIIILLEILFKLFLGTFKSSGLSHSLRKDQEHAILGEFWVILGVISHKILAQEKAWVESASDIRVDFEIYPRV